MIHGWVPRGDTSDPAVARDVGKAAAGRGLFFSNPSANMFIRIKFDISCMIVVILELHMVHS